jgi:uncharacterized membrane protein YccF (DUF307 family)
MSEKVITRKQSPGCLWQILWFAFVGWWLGEAWMAIAWVLNVTIIGLPLGIAMLNRLPKVMALREPEERIKVVTRLDGSVVTKPALQDQHPWILRALYFILVGWWFGFLWMQTAYALTMTYIGLPVGFWMFDRVPIVMTLKRG